MSLSSCITGLEPVLFAETAATLFKVQLTTAFIGIGILLHLFIYNTIQKPIKVNKIRLIIVLDTFE
ncbi:hypothetical protein JMN32_23745 [Fulvivirga sp. 29W222]|uniref:Uncharacterized protein n=1 Tax=Fulvivirga marina TaxID=2494733 RepID=A0A937KGF1_9BACT|nr:hypothetical protein [Fulvivirga marina]MBL6449345.1 hypothetical protein [Fulvivirga marina]